MEGVGEGKDYDQSIRYENKLISWTVVTQSFNPSTWKPELKSEVVETSGAGVTGGSEPSDKVFWLSIKHF